MSEERSTTALDARDGGALVPDSGNEGFFGRIAKFWRAVRAEARLVSWPSSKDVKNTTIITIIAVIFFAIYLFAADQAIVLAGRLGNYLLSLVGLA